MRPDALWFCRYVVHPRAFLVHRPHKPSVAKQRFVGELATWRARMETSKQSTHTHSAAADADSASPASVAAPKPDFSLSGATDRWFLAQKSARGRLPVLVAPGWERCRDSLPWWQVSLQKLQSVVASISFVLDMRSNDCPPSARRGKVNYLTDLIFMVFFDIEFTSRFLLHRCFHPKASQCRRQVLSRTVDSVRRCSQLCSCTRRNCDVPLSEVCHDNVSSKFTVV